MGISVDSVESHQKFIAKYALKEITLLSDAGAATAKAYGAKHPVLPVAKRIYIVVDPQRRVVFKSDTGFGLLDNQTGRLLEAIDRHLR